ncbi:MAG: hypothetical protein ACREX3_13395 [Gammaproteobacteria bacterium]
MNLLYPVRRYTALPSHRDLASSTAVQASQRMGAFCQATDEKAMLTATRNARAWDPWCAQSMTPDHATLTRMFTSQHAVSSSHRSYPPRLARRACP